jgi:hypothetical protein
MIPSLALLHIEGAGWRSPRLWVPLFLLWIPALLLAPLIVVVVVGLCRAGGIHPWRAFGTFWDLLSSLRGTHVEVRADGNTVQVRIV